MKKKCDSAGMNKPRGPENGKPSSKSESIGSKSKTSTKSKGFK